MDIEKPFVEKACEECEDSEDVNKTEKEIYDEVYTYLTRGEYPYNCTKQDKNSLRKKSKKFQV